MPVVEAMAAGKPVLCSNVTSLPEVAGDAAIYFDPTNLRQIAQAIEALSDTATVARLVRLGRQRAAAMGDGRDTAARYVDVFDQVLAARA